MLIVEAKDEASLNANSVVAWFVKWSTEEHINRLCLHFGLQNVRIPHRLFFWLSKDHPMTLSANIEAILRQPNNRIIFNDEIGRYEENFDVVGKWEKNNFLNFLSIKEDATHRSVNAIFCYIAESQRIYSQQMRKNY